MEKDRYKRGYDYVYTDERTIEEAALSGAKSVHEFRRLRNLKFAGHDVFEDPAWDMILAIFIDQMSGRPTSISSACYASNVAQTTALRWINRLVKEGLLFRENDPADARRSFLKLSDETHRRMIALLG